LSAKSSNKFEGIKGKVRHAFALKEEEGFSDDEITFMEKVAEFICRRQLEAAAIMGLVSCKPIGFLGSQLLIFLQPFLTPFFNEMQYQRLVNILSKREGIETFVQILERKSAESKKREKE